ncbi:MAG: accessory gene regulator B family protein [Lachnospiraceae bacterium]|nr:accessory gene regulator B family protein [Lachnospiraceae bacterium]
MDCLNEKIALLYTKKYCAGYEESVQEEYSQKIIFSIVAILSQTEKLLLVMIPFCMIGRFVEYLVLLLTLFLSRVYMGGVHKNSFLACLIHTQIIFFLAFFGGSYISTNIVNVILIFIIEIMIILMWAPIPSKVKPFYSKKRKKHIKKRGIYATIVLGVSSFFLWRYISYICSMLICVQVDAFCAVIRRRKNYYENEGKVK